jgi:hypothetical protein
MFPPERSEFCILNPWSHDQTFLAWGNVKNSLGAGKNVLVSTASLSILGNAISDGKLKQNTVVFSNNAWAHYVNLNLTNLRTEGKNVGKM